MPKKNLKPIPYFDNEDEEREFWAIHDSTDYIDWSKASKSVQFPNLKLSSKPVTIRMPEGLLNQIKLEANKRGIAYQALIKDTLYRAFS